MPIRITGLNSGLDTESIISELVSAYRTKEEKYQKAQTKLSWKQDAWKSLNIKVKGLYDNIKNLRFSSAWSKQKTTVSDSTKATITASGSAVKGTQTLAVNKLAKGTYITGGELSVADDKKLSKDTTLEDLGYTGDSTSISIKDSQGNVTKTINVTRNTTINEALSELNGSGVKATFDAARVWKMVFHWMVMPMR